MKRSGGVSGAVSLVMIFCVLCLAVFAVLTLSTAVREQGLAELTAQRAREYYEADAEAVAALVAIAEGPPATQAHPIWTPPTPQCLYPSSGSGNRGPRIRIRSAPEGKPPNPRSDSPVMGDS